MATIEDVRRIALALPGVHERTNGHTRGPAWSVAGGGIVWLRGPTGRDLAQLAEQGRQWPEGDVVGARTASVPEAAALVAADPDVFFTIPHFAGYPAVLVRLSAIDLDVLTEVVTDAWLAKAPRAVATAWLAERGLS